MAATWFRKYAAVLSGKSASTPILRARGALEEEAPPILVARSTRRTVFSTCGILVRVWGGCGCEGVWAYFTVPRERAMYGRVLSDVRL